uniref:exocyst complex component 2 n=1 Tax=Ciona intestinalis TaxID=7719 RepID=UPI000180D068|nr:exocyst complex component 2 [Ciona intestinalis]|eukprot:XP_002127048.1 exocyst complex component 2 [Ciona intestinalis]
MPVGPAPVVTGISPKDGTPFTKVTIRGENLGTSQSDVLGVAICGKNCSMTVDWVSPSKIFCRTAAGIGKGDIIVITKSGGTGSSTVTFTGLPVKKVGPLETSAVWVDETEWVDQRLDRAQKSSNISLRTDPLGLNSEELGHKTQAYMQLADLFGKGSPDPTDQNFEPSWFLLERHCNTSFSKLKEGHAYMKRKANRNTNNAPLNHVKDSLPVFFEVHETLSGIHHKMQRDEGGRKNGNLTDKLESTLNEASENANKLFDTVLSCKDRADSIRNTLNVLQRFKFLFNLPLNIEKNIQRGDYGVVINDYEKAKSLFSETDVDVFKKVFAEVEKRIEKFREQLKQEVQELPSPLHRQKKLIRYLLGLGESGDPGWECLVHQHGWIQESMIKCKDRHIKTAFKCTENLDEAGKVQVCHQYLEELTSIATSQIPEHWNLWQHYSTGVILSETGEKSSDVENLKEMASKHSKQMKGLLRDTVILFVNLLRAAFLPATLHVDDDEDLHERESYGVWPSEVPLPATVLYDCVRAARQCLIELSSLTLPHGTLQSLNDVIHDLRVLSLSTFLQEATDDIRGLRMKETWEVSNKGVTALPSQFHNITVALVSVVRDVLESLPGEEPVFARVAVQSRVTQDFTRLFTTFSSCLERCVFIEESESDSSKVPQESLPPLEQRLVIGISNLSYTKQNLLHPLIDHFRQLHFPNIEVTEKTCDSEFSKLDEKFFEAYVEHRVEPLTGALEPGMYAGSFDWNECLRPEGVRPYIKTALMSIITIHAEVYSINPDLVPRFLIQVIQMTSEEVLRLIQCIRKIGTNGSMQARLDIEALQQATAAFESTQSSTNFVEALDSIPDMSSAADRRFLDENINKFKSLLIFQLRCFS